MLPDYAVYEELRRRKELEELDHRTQLDLPLRIPLWPEPDREEDEREEDSGVIIIQM